MSLSAQNYHLVATAREKLRTDGIDTYRNLGRIIAHAKLLNTLLNQQCVFESQSNSPELAQTSTRSTPQRPKLATVNGACVTGTTNATTQEGRPKNSTEMDNKSSRCWTDLPRTRMQQNAYARDLDLDSDSDSDSDDDFDLDSDSDFDSGDSDDVDDELDGYDHLMYNFSKIFASLKASADASGGKEHAHPDLGNENNDIDVTITEVTSEK